jgi:ABC-type maltose transport system permease subunit
MLAGGGPRTDIGRWGHKIMAIGYQHSRIQFWYLREFLKHVLLIESLPQVAFIGI